MLTIREATERDRDAVWEILRSVLADGDTYLLEPDTPRADVLAYWFAPGHRSYVAESDGRVVGAYWIRANQPGLGAHVANAAYVVAPSARGLGVGHALGEHSLAEARRVGFRAMQFNCVVATNHTAIRLWQRLGFEIVGTLPRAFRHRTQGFVDAHVMFRSLTDAEGR